MSTTITEGAGLLSSLQAAAAHGLRNIYQIRALLLIAKSQENTSGALAAVFGIPHANLTGITDALVAKGLIFREHCQLDRRIILLHATEKGDQVAAHIINPL